MDDKKLEFIQDELESWALWIDGKLRDRFKALDIGYTEELINSLGYQVFQEVGGNDGEYQLNFLQYGRMLDMGAGRGSKDAPSENRKKFQDATRGKIRKPKKWYGKTTYGGLGRLINSLVTGYQQASATTIKESLE